MKKIIIIIATLVVLGTLVFISYKSLVPGVPQEFIDKHNEIVSLQKEAEKVADLTNMPEMEALDKQMSSEDYKGALSSVEAAISRKKESDAKLTSIKTKLAELKIISSKITDSEIKANSEKFIDVANKENVAKINYNDLQVQMLEKLGTMIDILVKNSKTISAADEKAIDGLTKEIEDIKGQLSKAEDEVNKIQDQYKEMEKEFFKLAGLEVAK